MGLNRHDIKKVANTRRVSIPSESRLSKQPNRAELRRKLSANFNKEELFNLCFDLNIEYENLPTTKDGLVRELVALCERHESTLELIEICQRLRPNVVWGETPIVQPQQSLSEPPTHSALDSSLLTEIPLPTLVLIPSGQFVMGSGAHDPWALDSEKPQHTYTVDSYFVSKHLITNAQYHAFIERTGYQAPKNWKANELHPDAPVTHVSWHDCLAYCQWLKQVTTRDFRLPTEAEWEKAARGLNGYYWPWGNEFDEARCNIASNLSKGGITEVGRFSPLGDSPYGVSDMAGNVWEWTSSLLMPYPYANDDREDLTTPGERVLRGGSWLSSKKNVRCSYRNSAVPNLKRNDIGFRIACSE